MWIHKLEMENIRAFTKADIEFSKSINIVVGPNNAGKSTLLLPLLNLQKGLPALKVSDIRLLKEVTPKIKVTLKDDIAENSYYFLLSHDYIGLYKLDKALNNYEIPSKYLMSNSNNVYILSETIGAVFGHAIPSIISRQGNTNLDGKTCTHIAVAHQFLYQDTEKGNLIFPFLTKRKVCSFDETTNENVVTAVDVNFKHLNVKIDRVSAPTFQPGHDFFTRACDTVLGFRLGPGFTAKGKQVVYTVLNAQEIPLHQMGEGVVNVLGLVADLAIAEDKVFIIEEPENDIHPKALKALMDCIIEKSQNNQFIITTHSNIVLKRLGARPETRIFHVQSDFEQRLPTSTVKTVANTPEDRKCILQDLGYELDDADVWSGWLFLEESSAERIIREFLIPWFAPKLTQRLKTFSAHSASQVTPKFDNFNDLFVFVHLVPTYKDKAWVVIDGGEEEQDIIEKLKKKYTQWDPSHFINLSKHNFEEYYPEKFASDFNTINKTSDKQDKREQKRKLLDSVLEAIRSNEPNMKAQFEVSAKEVIAILKDIEVTLTTN